MTPDTAILILIILAMSFVVRLIHSHSG